MERRAIEVGREMLNDPRAWLAERIFEAQQTHFEVSNVAIKQYTLG